MDFFLTETEDNPVPPGAYGNCFLAFDGLPIRYGLFHTAVRPFLGTIIVVPGRNEPIEKYFETIADLMRIGYDVAAMDLRGQGFSGRMLSDARKGHVGTFADYVRDLRRFLDEVVLPDCRGPFFVIAHSTGGLATLLATPFLSNQISRIALSAPLLGFGSAPLSSRRLGQVTRLLTLIGLGARYMPGRAAKPETFADNSLTSDYARYTRNLAIREVAPELALGGPTIGWIAAACTAIDVVRDPEFIAAIRIPLLLVAAGADSVVSNRAIEDFARRPRAGALLTIDGARHELMQEADVYREPFLAAVHAYFSGDVRVDLPVEDR